MELHESLDYGIEDYYLHPSVLDACLHTIFAAKMSTSDEERGVYLPVHIDRYKFHTKPKTNTVYSYVQVAEASSKALNGDFWILDVDGTLVAEVQGLRCKYIEGSRNQEADLAYSGCYEYKWKESSGCAKLKPARQSVLVLSERDFSFILLGSKSFRKMELHVIQNTNQSILAIDKRCAWL